MAERASQISYVLFCCLLVMTVLNVGFIIDSIGRHLKPTVLAEEGRSYTCKDYECKTPITPRDIKLRFVTREEFVRLNPVKDVLGYTFTHRQPCEIVLPAEGAILGNPFTGFAYFDYSTKAGSDLAYVLPHELMHCMGGNWHKDGPISDFEFYRYKMLLSHRWPKIEFMTKVYHLAWYEMLPYWRLLPIYRGSESALLLTSGDL